MTLLCDVINAKENEVKNAKYYDVKNAMHRKIPELYMYLFSLCALP